MHKKSLPIGVLVMVFVVLLAAAGLSYGYWTDSITANGTLTAGDLDIEWSGTSSSLGQLTYGNEVCQIAVDSENPDHLIATLSNLHPGSNCTLKARVHNVGTVPVEITGGDTQLLNGQTTLDNELDVTDPVCDSTVIAANGTTWCQITVTMDWDAGNSTEGLTSTYSAHLDVVQYNNDFDGSFGY